MNKVCILLILFTLPACSGITFNNSANAFKSPSATLSERTLWHDPSIIQYKLQSLSGYIIQKKSGQNKFKRIKQIIPNNFLLEPQPITDGEFYHSLVNSKFVTTIAANVPILSAAASLNSEQMMEITIIDKALIHIDDSKIPWTQLKAFVDANPLEPNDERFWVQGVMVTQMLTKTATKITSDAHVSGSAYQVDGQTYNASETQDKTPYITMLTLDIDEAIGSGAGVLSNDKEKINKSRKARSIHNAMEL